MTNVWNSAATARLAVTSGAAHEVDPISRIEGHLGVKVVTDATGGIIDANAHGNLWRGFENFLLGRDINDAITFVQRICGVCPVPHGMTSTYCVDNVLGYSRGHITFATAAEPSGSYGAAGTYGVPAKAVVIRNLVMACDSIMSSITHFYHLAAPSYVQGPNIPPWTPYFDATYYADVLESNGEAIPKIGAINGSGSVGLWDAVILSYVKALRVRRLVFEAGALFAGRMPMTSCYTGGGVTNDKTEVLTSRIARFETLMTEVGRFVVNEYLPIVLALGALYPEFDSQTNVLGSINGVPRGFGAGLGRFLAWGAFPGTDGAGTLASAGGVFDTNTTLAGYPATEDVTHFRVTNKSDVYTKFLTGGTFAVPENLTEDIVNSRYDVDTTRDAAAYSVASGGNDFTTATAAYPGAVSRTKPNRTNGYTFMKAPRWAGQACEVGPFARLVVAGIYPVASGLLSTIPGYKELYTVDGLGGGGLNTAIIAEDIVYGLSNDGLVPTVAGFILGLRGGLSTIDRLRGRAIETLVLVQAVLGAAGRNDAAATPALRVTFAGGGWLDDLAALAGTDTWRQITLPVGERQGWGANEAARGALMHQATIVAGEITKYQCIVPTTWNGSPKTAADSRGAIEQAMIGASFSGAGASFTGQGGGTVTTAGGVEVLRIAQSFDPCIACAIH
ncbi:MAG: nickel-dependent hydrogenase large subunit [Coriobacteriia bacterium]|nr:nickel-dependent hydrogenase large subunit [Coriobacteriia bacterium]